MVKLLQQNPGVAIPVILSRLQQKDGEWRRIKDDMTPLWGKVSSSALWSGRVPAIMHDTVPVWAHDIKRMPAIALEVCTAKQALPKAAQQANWSPDQCLAAAPLHEWWLPYIKPAWSTHWPQTRSCPLLLYCGCLRVPCA